MAAGMASGEVNIIVERLNKLLTEEDSLLLQVEGQIRALQTQLQSMIPFLVHAETKKPSLLERLIKVRYKGAKVSESLTKETVDLARDAENAIDKFMVDMTMQKRSTVRKLEKMYHTQLKQALRGIVRKLEKMHHKQLIKQALCGIVRNITITPKIYESQTGPAANDVRPLQYCQTDHSSTVRRGPIVREPHMVGRDDEMQMLLDQLIEGELQLTVVSIVGITGIGKTTLARKIYNSIYIENYFDCRAWASTSEKLHDVKDIVEAIVKCLMPLYGSKKEVEAHEPPIFTLAHYLRDKRYLIVLDDVLWSTEVWKHLKPALPDDENGSRVLLTSRKKFQANDFGVPQIPLHLESMDIEHSRTLLFNRVLGDGNCPPELEHVGNSIVGRCSRLPLLILLIGGLLLSKKEKNILVWSNVDGDLREAAIYKEMKNIPEIVSLSYIDLPHYLKPCFLYFCLFRKDFEISTRQLFQLWIAEGFIQDDSEAVAEEYLEELIDRGLIQVVRRRSDGRIKTCRIHDLLNHYSLMKAHQINFLQILRPSSKSRRIAMFDKDIVLLYSDCSSPHIRSFLCISITSDKSHLALYEGEHICKRFRLLRVMDLGALVLDQLPKGIENLIHLRYLRLNAPFLNTIPSEVLCNLRNLYTLDMPSSHIKGMPNDFWTLKNLRHLNFGFISLPGNPQDNRNSLSNLHFLSTLCPSSCTQDVLGRLPSLQTLRICGDLSSHHKALSNNLSKLCCLESLKLVREANLSPSSSIVLSDFIFPQSLTQLSLRNTELRDDPMRTLEKLKNLQVLKLKHNSYWGRKLVCSSTGFPRLQVLHLKSMQWLEEWTMETGSMPVLVCLVINPCACLRRLPEELWRVKTFCKLELWWPCPELKPRLREIEEMDRYDIQIYPSGGL